MSNVESDCSNCKFELINFKKYPCSECSAYSMDKWVWEGEIDG